MNNTFKSLFKYEYNDQPLIEMEEIPNMGTYTENGALSLNTTLSARVDFFFKLTRDIVENEFFEKWLLNSWKESPIDTMKIIFNSRDCRGGKGDRRPFLAAMHIISDNYPEWFESNYKLIPNYGRWLDLIEIYTILHNEKHKQLIVTYLVEKLIEDRHEMDWGEFVSLLAKWIPTEKKKYDRSSDINDEICKQLFNVKIVNSFIMARYRKEYISPLRAYIQLCERYMCANEWDKIHYSNVPSIAMKKYRKAFERHSPEEFRKWLDDVKNKKQKINVKQLYPHELVHVYFNTQELDEVVEEQWKTLVENTKKLGTFENALAICDVSGSMEGTPMDVSVALGILVGSCTKPPFNNIVISFSENPSFIGFSNNSSLLQKVKTIMKMNWGMNTDLEKVFKMILTKARENNISFDKMPKKLFVFSDMQFDQADYNTKTNFENIKLLYKSYGYEMPQLIFWNLRSNSTYDMPIEYNEKGVALLSGYSPSLLKSILSGNENDLTPYLIMRKVIDDERYNAIQIPQSTKNQ